ncbi:MAG: hypothetical protein WCJ58_08735 [bacterium]
MNPNSLPAKLKPLFWEYDLNKLDPLTHAGFIIGRIMEKGRIEDLQQLFKIYQTTIILEKIQNNPNITNSTKIFWQNLLLT